MSPAILVVDDSAPVRLFLAAVLPRFGFRVRTAAGGREALDLYRLHGPDTDLVLMDVQMPDLDGPETLAALRQLNPAVRCCLMSADSGRYTPQQLLGLGAIAFVEKPFATPAGLARILWALVGCRDQGQAAGA